VTIIAVIAGSGVFDMLDSSVGIRDPNAQSTLAEKLINTKLNAASVDVILLLSSTRYAATDPVFAHAATQLLARLKAAPQVVSVTSYYSTQSADFLAQNKHETFALLQIAAQGDKTRNYNAIVPLIVSPVLHIDIGGAIVAQVQFNNQLKNDLTFAEAIALPIVGILLFFIFGGLVAALLPLLIGGFSIMSTFALLDILARFMDVSTFAVDVTAFIGLGLAIDYSLFIVARFREELLQDEQDVAGALQRTMATAGRTVLFSGLTVGISLIGLLIFPEILLRSIGLAAIITAVVAMLATQVVLATLLALLGTRINALSLRRRRKIVASQVPNTGMWYRLSYTVMRFSIPVMLGTIVLLALLGSPFLHAKFSTASENVLPPGSAATVNQRLLNDFPNQGGTSIDIAVRTSGSALSPANLATLYAYVHKLQVLPGVRGVDSLVSVDPRLSLTNYQQMYAQPSLNPQVALAAKQFANQDLTKVTVNSSDTFDSAAATSTVQKIRAIEVPAGFVPMVGGDTADQLDLFTSLTASIPYALLIMIVAIFILLFLMTGSLIMPFKAIILNIFSLTATFGALVWIFQDGHLQGLLDFQSVGSLDSTGPVLVFAIAFGLSMDYEVFLLGRIKELFDQTGDNRKAVALGLQRTGQLITSAALLQALVVGAFGTSKILQVQQLGLGVALAIVMDATLVRMLLVPSMMNLLGKWNWWAPRPLRVLWQRIGLRETLAIEVPPVVLVNDMSPDTQVEETSV
jgi:RND superfamily putative drug exporter